MNFKAVRLDEIAKRLDEDRKKKSQDLNPGANSSTGTQSVVRMLSLRMSS